MNLGNITLKAFQELDKLDKTLVDTKDYMGIAYFWAHDYRHYMRDASYAKRRKIHNLGLDQNIDFLTDNPDAWFLIRKVLNPNYHRLLIEEEK